LTADHPEDRLLFDYQSQVAESLGYTQPDIRGRSEALMHTFYRATKAIKQLNGILIPVLKNHQTSSRPQHIHPIDSRYKRIGHQIAANDLALFERNPEHIFTIIQTMQEQNITTIEPQTLRAWW
ncbi:[protein-PII] uridylyltransferase, partial [Neisseria sp. P0001.S004]